MSNSPNPIDTVPDPDVGGPGVIVGFVLTGLLATLASGGLALLSSLRDDDKSNESRSPQWTFILWLLKASSPEDVEDPVEFWTPILEGFVLNLSDQQLITGLFIVTLSCVKYFNIDLNSLVIAGDLAFFSMITHYATILTVQRMLRDHFKLAFFRMVIVFITFVMWLVIETAASFTYVRYLKTGIKFLYFLALFSSIIEACGFLWVFWAMCLSLSATDLTLKARKAIGRGDLSNDINRQHIVEWLESSEQEHSLPTSTLDHLTFPLRRSLSSLFKKFSRIYITTKSPSLENFLWVTAEIIFPFRMGYVLGAALFILGIINLSLDLSLHGLASTWGFGQLLPAFMVLLPFLSLAEVYAQSKLDLTKKRAVLAQQSSTTTLANQSPHSTHQSLLARLPSNSDNAIQLQGFADANRPQSSHQRSPTPESVEREPLGVTSSRKTLIQPSRHRAISGHSTW